ncbi:hypothetical protein [Staphylothermus hellenicus]|uniref:Uncharacterized protein n=1 Tax=Staphylothermus hellenicus (strain DSM 12710 / JCM 10830 / BK20S6-10-b1 / P8) TaxID=591019 RepID=D7D8C9_STAHD|nr:hypothetical protein [Staphylothermus hellenicus]ADI32025.1 hypothetical protein Shell_0917 [Staphylothermus hellenicus DSM 12710]
MGLSRWKAGLFILVILIVGIVGGFAYHLLSPVTTTTSTQSPITSHTTTQSQTATHTTTSTTTSPPATTSTQPPVTSHPTTHTTSTTTQKPDTQPPTITLFKEFEEDGRLHMVFKIDDESGVSKAYALVKYPSGKTYNESLSKVYNYYPLVFNLSDEGKYLVEVFAKDSKGNLGSFNKSYSFFDKPQIELVAYDVNPPTTSFNISVKDTSGISKVLVEAFGKDYLASPVNVDSKGNGLYNAKVHLPDLAEKVDYKVLVYDLYNNSASENGSFSLTEYQQYLTWAINQGYNLCLAEPFYKYQLIQNMFSTRDLDHLKHILDFAQHNGTVPPRNLAYLIVDQVVKDRRVSDKVQLIDKVLSNLDELKIYGLKRLDSVWLVNNATQHGFRSLEGLGKALYFSDSTNISLSYSNPLCYSALADIGYYYPQIFKYPYETKFLALQVGDVVYFYKIDQIKGKDYVWNGLIVPYASWRFNKLESGEFKPLGYKLTKGELKKLASWADPIVVQAAARSLYPLDELMDHDLLGYDSHRFFHDRQFNLALERGVKNMKYNQTLGASPFGYIYNLMMKDIQEKDQSEERSPLTGWTRYEEALFSWTDIPGNVWTNTYVVWKQVAQEYLNKSPELILVKGYPIALGLVDPPVNPHFYISGQGCPYYSKIIGAMLNRPTLVLEAPYPQAYGVHDEPFVVSDDGKLVGFWYSKEAFLQDYEGKPYKPYIGVYLVSDLKWKKFGKEELDKVLNNP